MGKSIVQQSRYKFSLSGILVVDILNQGSRSNEYTWQKSYSKQVLLANILLQTSSFKGATLLGRGTKVVR